MLNQDTQGDWEITFGDNQLGNQGTFYYLEIAFRIKQICGNSIIEGDEECDDGNKQAKDGCSSECQLQCGWKCPSLGTPCVWETCGNGKLNWFEQCDDGNNNDGDGCSFNCVIEN